MIVFAFIFIKHEIISFVNFFLISLCYYIFMSFAENLRNELTYNDIKIKELSARTKIPYTTLLSYMNDKKSLPNVEAGVKIAKILNVSVEYLVTGYDSSRHVRTNELYKLLDEIYIQLKSIIALFPKQ